MRKYLTVILVLSLSCKFYCQDNHKRLQRQMWYVSGGLYKGDTCSIYTDKGTNCSGYAVFGPDEIEMHLDASDNKFSCRCQFLNNKIMLHYQLKYTGANPSTKDVKLYYSLKELSGKDFLLVPISIEDYK